MDIVRSNLYIHSQIKIQLSQNDEAKQQRRLVDAEDNVQDQVRHFMQKAQLNAARSLHEVEQNEDAHQDQKYSPFEWLDDKTMLFIATLFVLMIAIGIILGYARKRRRMAR